MTLKKCLILYTAVLLILFLLSGCSREDSFKMANELRFSLDEITDLTVSYDDEDVSFFSSGGNTLVVKEYMTVNESRCYARVRQNKNSIHISEGKKPIFKNNFSRRIEVFLPKSYKKNLMVTTSDGNVDMSDIILHVSSLRIDSTSGTVQVNFADAEKIHLSSTSGNLKLGQIKARIIVLETTSGNVTCSKVNGNVTYTSTSGNAQFKSAVGSGSYKAGNSGRLSVSYTEVTGDLFLFNKNDNIELALPAELEFEFEAAAKNGTVSTSFLEPEVIDGGTASVTVGNNPTVEVKVETRNGNIEVTQ